MVDLSCMKNGPFKLRPLNTALPFVISTGAKRSGEICGSFLEMFFYRADLWRVCFAVSL